MQRHLICAAALVAATAVAAQAQQQQQSGRVSETGGAGETPQMRQAIESHFPGAATQIQGQHQENGVAVYDVQITPKAGGQSLVAIVTQYGDFLASGTELGANAQNLPPAAAEVTQNIWKTPPADVRQMVGTFYWVTIGGSNMGGGNAQDVRSRQYALRFDATGNLLDIKAPSQLHATNWRNEPDAPAAEAQRIRQEASARYRNARIEAVKALPNAPGMYEARFTINGQDGWMQTDASGQIADEATTVAVNQLPRPIQDTINAAFKGDRVTWAARDDIHFYEVREQVGNEAVTIRVQADGDILSVRSGRGMESGAIPAAGRTPARR